MYGVRICSFHNGTFEIETGGVVYPFDWSEQFGPSVIGKRDEILANQPGPRNLFWTAVTLWAQQGKRTTNGDKYPRCVWDEPPDPTAGFVQIGKRTWVSESIAKKYKLKQEATGLPEKESK